MEHNTELICCAGCGAPLDVDGELIKCKVCGATNLLGERAAKALQHAKKIPTPNSDHSFGTMVYSSSTFGSSAAFYPVTNCSSNWRS